MSIENNHEHEPLVSNPEQPTQPEETEKQRKQREAADEARLERSDLSDQIDRQRSENNEENWEEPAEEPETDPSMQPDASDKPLSVWDKLGQFSEKMGPVIEAITEKISELRINIARNTAQLFNSIRKIPMFANSLDTLLAFVGANTSILYQELSNRSHLTFEESSSGDVDMLVMQLESDFNNQAAINKGDDFRSFVGRTLDRFGSNEQTVTVETLHEAAVTEAATDRKQAEAEPAEEDSADDNSAKTPAETDGETPDTDSNPES